MKCYKSLRLDCEMSVEKNIAELIKTRRVGSLGGELVYFIPARGKSFYLVIESSLLHFRKLTDEEHQRFMKQSRVEGAYYKKRSRESRQPPRRP